MPEFTDIDLATAPAAVADCRELLTRLEAWHRFSRNEAAMSCADAASKRHPGRQPGINPWEELKTRLGRCRIGADNWQPFLAHCRGDRELDETKLRIALDASKVERMPLQEVQALGVEYGIINPFLQHGELLQVFDSELLVDLGGLETLMTNAGEHTWAVRFYIDELVEKLPQGKFADIIDPTMLTIGGKRFGPRGKKRIGILTGNPPKSGEDLYWEIKKQIRQLLGGNFRASISEPEYCFESHPGIGLSLFLEQYEPFIRKHIKDGIVSLCNSGADIIAHPAHSTHYFEAEMREIAESHGKQFVSMTEITAQKMRDLRAKEVALLGIKSVTDLNSRFSPYRSAFAGFTVHTPSSAGWKNIHDNAPELVEAKAGVQREWMRQLLGDEVPPGCRFVVLGMTELGHIAASLEDEDKLGKNLIDPIKLYAQFIAKLYLGT